METLHTLNIVLHVSAGIVALGLGLVALLTAKGGNIHNKCGNYFLAFVSIVIVTGLIGVFVFGRNTFLLVITVLTGYVSFSGYRALKFKSNAPRPLDIIVAVVSLSVLAYFLYFFKSIGMIWSPIIIYSTVGAMLLVVVYDGLRYLIPREFYVKRRIWLYEHIYKMTGAFSGLLSAFAGTVLKQYQPHSQYLPSVLGMVIIAGFMVYVYKGGVRKPALLIVLIGFSLPAFAQDKVTVNGQVLDAATQEPLPGANVYALSDWRNGSSTNEQGEFLLLVVANDSLMVTFVGYQEQVVPVNAAPPGLVVSMIAFAQDMETVTVRAASLVAEEFSIKKIEQLEIYTNPNAKADPLLAVNSLPAATTLDESANISLRGSSPAQTGIFLNDVPVYDAVRFAQLNGIGTFSIFNASIIRQLQVFPSNPPLEFGNTSAGLISLQTVDRLPERASGSLALSPANLGAYATLPVGKKAGLSLFSNYQPSSLLKVINNRALQDLQYFRTLDFGAHYVHALSERSTLKIFNYAVSERYRFASRHPSGAGTFRQRKQRNFTVANFRTRYEHATLALNGGFSASRMRFTVGNLDVDRRNRDIYLSANYTRRWETWMLKSGLTYDARRATGQGQVPVFDYAIAPQHPTYSYRATQSARVPEAYAYGKYLPNERWTFGGGVRKNLPLADQKSYLSYQFNTNYQLTPQQRLTLSAGRYHQHVVPPDGRTDNFYRSDQLSLDYAYEKKGKTLSAASFGKNTRYGDQQEQVYGAEVAADVRWSSKLRTQVSYTYLNATVREEAVSYASPYDLNYFVRGSASYQFAPQWTLSAIFLHRQGTYYAPVTGREWDSDMQVYAPQYAPADQSLRLPDYNTVDINLARVWPLSEKLSAVAFGSVNNLLNNRNVRTVNHNQDYSAEFYELFSQRTIYFGVVLQWQ